MTENTSSALDHLPARLKAARKQNGLSLEAVAKLSGVSKSMLSQIERGTSSPTISTLWNLTRALQVDFAGLLEEDAGARGIEVLRASEVPTIGARDKGCRISILSPPEDVGKHEVYLLSFEVGAVLDSAAHAKGTREHLTVLAGSLEVVSDTSTDVLAVRDTARYAADVAHRITAREASEAILIVMTQDAL